MLIDRLTAYARYRAVLDRLQVVAQAELDLALRTLHARPRTGPRGIRAHRAGGGQGGGGGRRPVSAADVADQVGISRATAQRYLSLLSDGGTIVMQLRYGSTGRPEHRFNAPD